MSLGAAGTPAGGQVLRTCSGGVIVRRVSVASSHHRSCLSATHMSWVSGSLVKVLCTRRWVECLLNIWLIAISHVFEYVHMFRVKVKPIGVNGMGWSVHVMSSKATCETTAIPARASLVRLRPAFTSAVRIPELSFQSTTTSSLLFPSFVPNKPTNSALRLRQLRTTSTRALSQL